MGKILEHPTILNRSRKKRLRREKRLKHAAQSKQSSANWKSALNIMLSRHNPIVDSGVHFLACDLCGNQDIGRQPALIEFDSEKYCGLLCPECLKIVKDFMQAHAQQNKGCRKC